MGANLGIIGGVRRTLARAFGGRVGWGRAADRRRARPALEGLEERQVLTGLTTQQVVSLACQVEAARIAPKLLDNTRLVSSWFGSRVGGEYLKSQLTAPALAGAMQRDGLGVLAGIPGATQEVARDIFFDMLYFNARGASGQAAFTQNALFAPTVSLVNQIDTLNARNSSLTTLRKLADYDWGRNTQLQATALSGVAPYGINIAAQRAGFGGVVGSINYAWIGGIAAAQQGYAMLQGTNAGVQLGQLARLIGPSTNG